MKEIKEPEDEKSQSIDSNNENQDIYEYDENGYICNTYLSFMLSPADKEATKKNFSKALRIMDNLQNVIDSAKREEMKGAIIKEMIDPGSNNEPVCINLTWRKNIPFDMVFDRSKQSEDLQEIMEMFRFLLEKDKSSEAWNDWRDQYGCADLNSDREKAAAAYYFSKCCERKKNKDEEIAFVGCCILILVIDYTYVNKRLSIICDFAKVLGFSDEDFMKIFDDIIEELNE